MWLWRMHTLGFSSWNKILYSPSWWLFGLKLGKFFLIISRERKSIIRSHQCHDLKKINVQCFNILLNLPSVCCFVCFFIKLCVWTLWFVVLVMLCTCPCRNKHYLKGTGLEREPCWGHQVQKMSYGPGESTVGYLYSCNNNRGCPGPY